MKFSYTALSSDNQKLTGVLEAENQNGAQEGLHKMGVSIISIKEITEAEYNEIKKKEVSEKGKSGINTFTFVAIDGSGKGINGTIDAKDAYTAYKRLITEYGFKIKELYLSTASEKEKADSLSKLSDYEIMLNDEGIYADGSNASKTNDNLDAGSEIDQSILDEIDNFIVDTKKVLSEHSNKFSVPFLRDIESALGELERIRTSNNINHITEICNKIYGLISSPDIPDATDGAKNNDSFSNLIGSLESTGIVKKQFSIHSKAVNLSKIKSFFSKTFEKLSKKKGDGETKKKETFLSRIRKKFNFKKKSIPRKKEMSPTKSKSIIKLFIAFITSSNSIVRSSKKQELIAAFKNLMKSRCGKKPNKENGDNLDASKADTVKSETSHEKLISDESANGLSDSHPNVPGWKSSTVLSETNSFIGWLLFFYIIFFFIVDFSYEKNIGVPREFIAKTLKTPLIIDITIFLLIIHLIFKLRQAFFKRNIIGSIFLFFLGIGMYSLIVLNF